MRTKQYLAIALSAILVAIVVTLSVGLSASAGQGKTYICHRTASETNPYVLIHVANPARVQAHLSGQGKGHFKTRVGSDYLPTQYEIANGCGATPPPTPQPTPTPTPTPTPPPDITAGGGTDAVIRICGDPRALIYLRNYEAGAQDFRVRFVSARTRQVVYVTISVPAYTTKVIKRWVQGQTVVKVWASGYPADGRIYPAVVRLDLLATKRVTRANNIGACPR